MFFNPNTSQAYIVSMKYNISCFKRDKELPRITIKKNMSMTLERNLEKEPSFVPFHVYVKGKTLVK
jgi:hypothetical protein